MVDKIKKRGQQLGIQRHFLSLISSSLEYTHYDFSFLFFSFSWKILSKQWTNRSFLLSFFFFFPSSYESQSMKKKKEENIAYSRVS